MEQKRRYGSGRRLRYGLRFRRQAFRSPGRLRRIRQTRSLRRVRHTRKEAFRLRQRLWGWGQEVISSRFTQGSRRPPRREP